MRIFTTRKYLLRQEKRSALHYYKNPKTLINQGTRNFPQLWHSIVIEILSNLIFGGYLAGTTPILSIRSLVFLLRRFYQERVRTMWLTDHFWHYHTRLDYLCHYLHALMCDWNFAWFLCFYFSDTWQIFVSFWMVIVETSSNTWRFVIVHTLRTW